MGSSGWDWVVVGGGGGWEVLGGTDCVRNKIAHTGEW